MASNTDLEILKGHVGTYPDFPKPGIIFRDMLPIFRSVEAIRALENLLVNHVKNSLSNVEVVVGLEARGFLLAPIVATRCGLPLVVIRKKGKLPGSVKSVTFSLEYGQDTFEIQDSSLRKGQKVLIIDDLLATGGTVKAACDLVKQCDGEVVQLLVLMELLDLNGRKNIPCPAHSFLSY